MQTESTYKENLRHRRSLLSGSASLKPIPLPLSTFWGSPISDASNLESTVVIPRLIRPWGVRGTMRQEPSNFKWFSRPQFLPVLARMASDFEPSQLGYGAGERSRTGTGESVDLLHRCFHICDIILGNQPALFLSDCSPSLPSSRICSISFVSFGAEGACPKSTVKIFLTVSDTRLSCSLAD